MSEERGHHFNDDEERLLVLEASPGTAVSSVIFVN